MGFAQLDANYASAVQKELASVIANFRELEDTTLRSFSTGNGTRKKQGSLVGLQVPYFKNSPHGSTAYSPQVGDTSFRGFVPATTGAMYVGLAFLALTIQLEMHHLADMKNGKIPESLYRKRDHAIQMHMKKKNWYAVGEGDGKIAEIASGASSTITFKADNTARGTSKGSVRLAVSPSAAAGDQIKYSAIDTSGTEVARFYVVSKPNATQAVVAIADSVGTLGALNVAGLKVVEQGHYNKVPRGLGYHINQNGRIYQGANSAVDQFLNSLRVDGGNATVTPTMITSAKGGLDTRSNKAGAGKKKVCHLTHGNYEVLANFGYSLRQYNAEKGQADTTFGLPRLYEDEDTVFFRDADMEDAYIYLREKEPYFEYNQMKFQNVNIDGLTIRQYVGANLVGSSEGFQNYAEACNFAWDGRGSDGKNKAGEGAANSSVVIDNLALPANTQVAQWAGF